MTLSTKARKHTDVAYTKTEYLMLLNWVDGTEAYCRKCDGSVPLSVDSDRLACPSGHYQHPINVVLNHGDRD